MSESASAHGTPPALIRTAGAERASGARKGCFGGIITGDTGLACHGATGDKSLVQSALEHYAVRYAVRYAVLSRRRRGMQRAADGVPRGTGLGAGATNISTCLGGLELPECCGRRRAVAVHCTSPSHRDQRDVLLGCWASGPAQPAVQRQRAGSTARPLLSLPAAFALPLPLPGGLAHHPRHDRAPSAAV